MLSTIQLFGIPVCAGSRDEVLRTVFAEAGDGRQIAVATLNAEMAVAASRNPDFKRLLAEKMLVIPDGKRIAVTARKALGVKLEVYPGIEFAFDLVKSAAERGAAGQNAHSIFLLGAKPGVAEKAAENLRTLIPGANIAGVHHGYFKGGEALVAEAINRSGATAVLAGMGSPYQEFWIDAWRDKLSARIFAGVGGSFEVWAGVHRRAPVWIRSAGIEWLYRAFADPRRIKRLAFIPAYLALERAELKSAAVERA